MGRAGWLLAPTLLALVCALAAAPRADAARNMEIAVQDDPLFVGNWYFGRDKGIARARQLQATRIRVNVSWTGVIGRHQARARKKPQNLTYDFSHYQQLVAITKDSPIRVQVALVGPAPRWAAGNRRVGPYKPNPKHYAEFVRAAVRAFPSVDRYSIWNEPNHVGWLAPVNSGRHYRRMYVRAYNVIKRERPSAHVLIGETSAYRLRRRNGRVTAAAPLAFLRQVTCANRSFTRARCRLRADGYAHHPYDFDHKPTYRFRGRDNVTISSLGRLTKALDRLKRSRGLRTPRGKALNVYLTEYGYLRRGKRRVPERRRAKWIVQAFKIAQKNRRVRQMLNYLMVRPPQPYAFFDTSLLSQNNSPTRTFTALRSWASGAVKSRRVARSAVLAGGPNGPFAPRPQGTGGGSGGGSGGGGGGVVTPPPTCLLPVLCP